MKHWLSESFNSVFLHVTQYYHTVKNIFDLSRAIWCHVSFDQVCIIVSYYFSRLEDTSNYSASVLQTNFAKNMSSITGRGIKSQMLYVSWQSCLPDYGNHFISCFLILPPSIGLRWCPDAVIIFLIYLLIHIFIVKHPKQNKWFKNSGTIYQCYLPVRHYCMMILLMLLAIIAPSSDYLAKQLTHLLVKPTEWVPGVLQSIETIMYAWSVSDSS